MTGLLYDDNSTPISYKIKSTYIHVTLTQFRVGGVWSS